LRELLVVAADVVLVVVASVVVAPDVVPAPVVVLVVVPVVPLAPGSPGPPVHAHATPLPPASDMTDARTATELRWILMERPSLVDCPVDALEGPMLTVGCLRMR
jgi:hypothetical protein